MRIIMKKILGFLPKKLKTIIRPVYRKIKKKIQMAYF